MRHAPLLPPYHDYTQLSLAQLSELALQTIDPTVDSTEFRCRAQASTLLSSVYDRVLVSQSRRTQNTAELLREFCELPEYSITEEINEIVFDPRQLVDEVLDQKNYLPVVRFNLFKALINGTNRETLPEIKLRLESFKKRLLYQAKSRVKSHRQPKTVLVITHGFLLRLIDLYFRQELTEITQADLEQVTNYDYLDGFSLTLD